jgi:hypothetical protein
VNVLFPKNVVGKTFHCDSRCLGQIFEAWDDVSRLWMSNSPVAKFHGSTVHGCGFLVSFQVLKIEVMIC